MQAQTSSTSKYLGVMDCAKSMYRIGSISSIYKGTFTTLLRDVPSNAAYFGTSKLILRELMILQDANQYNVSISLAGFAGGFAGWENWIVAIPIDIVKSRY
uniref:ADP,ATP carrier protein n=1 Tax=Proboscia inermis TaxID=420281 RepID=A0A7S0GLH9_9STRA|mmetsp:Transcript_826/g.869  ORF Transcript_826/g.869 Transcript_826/m.869 type:complete len:101 (+) Transcript_826:263-565(+)